MSAAPVVLVTGGSSGIGAGIVRRLHQDGHRVLAVRHRGADRARALTQALDPTGQRLAFAAADLADAAAPGTLVQEAVQRFGRLDGVVHCAATIDTTPLEDLDAGTFDRVLRTNVTAAFLLLRAACAVPTLSSAVVISSIAATYTGPDSAAYEASKAALSMLTRSLAAHYAPRVRINAIAPGAVETERSIASAEFPRAMLQDRIPLGRLGEPADIAAAALFLLSADSGYITGQVVTVDGGLSLKLT
ncbi:SDR family oxidoreductase [Kitasatospora purpeofusca]|uniref:SDR family NAD(P)-dependent oxidoreductase n=1 Tax=Kitasatospora purpeofusca TaxID=67352 RepID=UPI002E11C1F9|nr:SDR family oxidoreductase [Kitasatospora purpeofusca]